jgi:hypothetical protein
MAESTTTWRNDRIATPWFALLAGPVVGILHEAVGYLMVSQSCSAGFPWFSIGGFSGIRLLMLILGVISEAVLIAAMISGYHAWRQEDTLSGDNAAVVAIGRARFMGLVGMILSAGFALYVLFATVPALVLDVCHFL